MKNFSHSDWFSKPNGDISTSVEENIVGEPFRCLLYPEVYTDARLSNRSSLTRVLRLINTIHE